MKPSFVLVCALLSACSVFDLPELSEGKRPDASMPVESDGAPTPDAPDLPDPVDAGPDAFDDPSIPDGAVLGSCDPARWTVSASDSHPVNPPSYAVDGLLPSRWSTGAPQTPGQTFDIDFGGFVMVNQVAINPVFEADGHGDYPRGVDVYVSPDGVDFTRKVQSATFGVDPGVATVDWNAHAARVLRLQLTQGASAWWSIHELTVGCTVPGGAPPADAGPLNDGPDGGVIAERSGWVATGLPTEATNPAGHAFDGNAGTRWATGKTPQYGDEVFRLDLGASMETSGVVLRAATGDFASAYLVELSNDDSTYVPVAQGLGADETRISWRRQSARYVRIKQIGAGYAHWWGINEIDVVK